MNLLQQHKNKIENTYKNVIELLNQGKLEEVKNALDKVDIYTINPEPIDLVEFLKMSVMETMKINDFQKLDTFTSFDDIEIYSEDFEDFFTFIDEVDTDGNYDGDNYNELFEELEDGEMFARCEYELKVDGGEHLDLVMMIDFIKDGENIKSVFHNIDLQ